MTETISTKNYMDLLPQDIQDKIWDDVFQNFRLEHQSKFRKILYKVADKALLRQYWNTIKHILSIDNEYEQAIELTMYYQWLADNSMICCSGSFKYNEVYLLNPYRKVYKSIGVVSSCWRKDFERRGLNWFTDPIYIPVINSSVNDGDNELIEYDLWVDLAPNVEIQVVVSLSDQFLD